MHFALRCMVGRGWWAMFARCCITMGRVAAQHPCVCAASAVGSLAYFRMALVLPDVFHWTAKYLPTGDRSLTAARCKLGRVSAPKNASIMLCLCFHGFGFGTVVSLQHRANCTHLNFKSVRQRGANFTALIFKSASKPPGFNDFDFRIAVSPQRDAHSVMHVLAASWAADPLHHLAFRNQLFKPPHHKTMQFLSAKAGNTYMLMFQVFGEMDVHTCAGVAVFERLVCFGGWAEGWGGRWG